MSCKAWCQMGMPALLTRKVLDGPKTWVIFFTSAKSSHLLLSNLSTMQRQHVTIHIHTVLHWISFGFINFSFFLPLIILILQAPATIVDTSDHHLRPQAASNAPSASQLASHLNARSKYAYISIYVYIQTYTHTHTYIYICIYIYTYRYT